MGMFEFIKIIIIVSFFYGTAISLFTFALTGATGDTVNTFTSDNLPDYSSTQSDMESMLNDQLNIPVLEIGALVFYSGNILVNIFMNSIFAVPQMISFILFGFTMFFPMPNEIVVYVQLFITGLMVTLYILGIVRMLLSLRSGSAGMI